MTGWSSGDGNGILGGKCIEQCCCDNDITWPVVEGVVVVVSMVAGGIACCWQEGTTSSSY